MKRAFIIIGIFWLSVIGFFIFKKETALRSGTEILLQTRQVDPLDLFRGNYMTLSYVISRISKGPFLEMSSNFKKGDKIYVVLIVEDGVGKIRGLSNTKPEDVLFIEGVITKWRGDYWEVEYGIESYFIPEKKVNEVAELSGEMVAKIFVDSDGKAVLKNILVDGEELEF